MTTLILPKHEKRFFIAILIVAVLAYLFWTGSRYPSLNEKAMMSGAIQLEDALSFEARFTVTDDMGWIERIFWSTLNWINTNRKGMTFGVLFAAAFLTAAAHLRVKSMKGRFSNSALGLALGTPLGVCVNCAAPIAKGMYASGLRAETTLSAMIASPTLNVVVLTMLFSLVPFYMAVTKVALSLLIILVLVPLICRMLDRTQIQPSEMHQTPWSAAELANGPREDEDMGFALVDVFRSYLVNLWYIIKLTVPLMILAGFLGTVAAVLLPGDLILGLPYAFWILVLVALVGVFLPVPIGFDVVMAGALLALGLEQGYVMALLFTLGSYSVYSFMIVAGSVGQRAAWLLTAAVVICGILAGAGTQRYHEWQTDRALRMLTGEAETTAPYTLWAAQAAGADPWTVTSPDAPRITITATPMAPRSPGAGGFSRIEASTQGIDKPLEFSMDDMWPPFWEGRSVASGDIDRDGDLDLVIASTEATLYLYLNDGTGQFVRQSLDFGPLQGAQVFNAVLVDLDNDGWRDLLIATYRQGLWIWGNTNGAFTSSPTQVAGTADDILAMAISLADADRDGRLDAALGMWASGWYRRIPGEESRNRILWDIAGAQRATPLPGIPGETLSILFTDFDSDSHIDLIVGNDFEIPDYFYHGDGMGGFDAITHADASLPHTTTTTMAIKTADLLNDGKSEIYMAQIAGRSSGVSSKLKMQPLERYCDSVIDPASKQLCQKNMAIKTWYRSGNNFDPSYASKCQELSGSYQAECKAMLIKDLAIQRGDAKVCALIPASQPQARSFCDLHFLPVRAITADEAEASIQQILRSNVLLEPMGNGTWADKAEFRGLDVGGWSWDTKIADFDLDGWQDVYIVNGTWVPNEVSPSNLYFSNLGDGRFQEASGPMGLEDYLMTAAATQFDMDGDGDLDLLTHPVNGPLILFRNDTQDGNAIAFELEDMNGNRDGIGAVLRLIDYKGRTHTREIQMGGGFMSFDAPRIHFGLGQAGAAESLEVIWATGDRTHIEGPLEAGSLYRIFRAEK